MGGAAALARLKRLSRRSRDRRLERCLVLDGPLVVSEALRAGAIVELVVVEPGADPSVVAAATDAGAEIVTVPAGALRGAVEPRTPQGIAAVARSPVAELDVALEMAAAGPLALVLDGVADPGNAGTLLRAAEASGARAVLFCGSAVDPTGPKCVRSSAGALFHVVVAVGGEVRAVLEDLGSRGVRRFATAADVSSLACDEVDLRGPAALVLGNEAHGLRPDLDPCVDSWVRVPMDGRSESLNVAMAGSILCYEALRQRRSSGAAR